MKVRTLDELDFSGKRVLIRADLNVPMKDGAVADPARITACAPTIREIVDRGGTPVVISHLGRPKGAHDPTLSLHPIVLPLSEAVGGLPVHFANDCIGVAARSVVDGMRPGAVALLENLRFHPGEEANDAQFADELAALADLYVDDAFSAAHRAHASIVGVPRLLPSAAGRLMQRELDNLETYLSDPKRPCMAILGGAKVASKIGVLRALVKRVDTIILGGGMGNTFLAAHGMPVGRSLYEKGMAQMASEVDRAATAAGCEIVLPIDAVVAEKLEAGVPSRTMRIADVSDDAMILDIGPETVACIAERLSKAKTVVWNGPLGAAEVTGFEHATRNVAKLIAERTQQGSLVSVAGGGDTGADLAAAGVHDRFTYVSLGGGAFLEWLEGKELPGIAALARTE